MPWFYELAKPYAVRPNAPQRPKESNGGFRLLPDAEQAVLDKKFYERQSKASDWHKGLVAALKAGNEKESLRLLHLANRASPHFPFLEDYLYALLAFDQIGELRRSVGSGLAKRIWFDRALTFDQSSRQYKFRAQDPFLHLCAFLVSREPGEFPDLDLTLSNEIWRLYGTEPKRLEFWVGMNSKRLNWSLILIDKACPSWLHQRMEQTLLSYSPRHPILLETFADRSMGRKEYAAAASLYRRAAAAHPDTEQTSLLFAKYLAAKERARLKPSPTASTPLISTSPAP